MIRQPLKGITIIVSKTMPSTNIETPDWLREMETILEELNEGVVVVDDQLRVIFANEALRAWDTSSATRFMAARPMRFSPGKTFPIHKRAYRHQLSEYSAIRKLARNGLRGSWPDWYREPGLWNMISGHVFETPSKSTVFCSHMRPTDSAGNPRK